MKLALGPLGAMLVGVSAMAFGAGCGASGAHRAQPSVGTTELSSVTITLSRLEPAAWEDALVPPAPAQTWGVAPEPAPELMSTP